jgi:hypothetical protein
LKKMHKQIIMWRHHNNFFDFCIFCVIDNLKVDVKMPQIMYCVLCYNNVVDPSIFNQ